MQTVRRDCVVALIETADGKILLGKKDPNGGGVYPDTWHLPGGGIEPGESHHEALQREVKEEVGIDIGGLQTDFIDGQGYGEYERIDPKTHTRTLHQMRFNVYRISIPVNSGAIPIELNGDLVQYAWASREELTNYWLTPPSMTLFSRLGYI